MNAPETALPGKHTGAAGQLYMAFELSDKKWLLVVSDGARGPSRYTVDAGDQRAVLDAIAKAKARCALVGEVVVRSCYEAGRDGFWLHRWLLEQGIDNMVVDSASIEVNRRARRAKTDRLDGGKLLTMLMRYLGGERRVWSVVRVPTPQEEDARRAHRELEHLRQERTAHSNRIGALLVLHNRRVKHVGGRGWGKWWTRHGPALLAALRAGIEREMTRLVLVKAQIKTLEAQQCTAVAAGQQPQVAQLSQVRGVGLGGAWILVQELFGWRRFHNRRQVAGCAGSLPRRLAAARAKPSKALPRPATSGRAGSWWSSGGVGCAINRRAT